MKIKHIILCLFITVVSLPLSSQVRSRTSIYNSKSNTSSSEGMGLGLEIAYLQPDKSSYFGFQWKSAPDIVFTFRGNKNWQRFRWGGSLGYAPFSPTYKTFPIWCKWNDVNKGDIVFLGESTHSIGNYVHLGIPLEYKFLKKPLSPFIGLEPRMAGFFYSTKDIYYKTDTYDPGSMFNEDEFHMEFGFYLIPKIGMVYDIEDKMSFLINMGMHGKFDVSPIQLAYTFFSVSLSAIYYF